MVRAYPVHPVGTEPHDVKLTSESTSKKTRSANLLVRCYNLALWGFLVIILFAQVFGIVWTVVRSEQHLYHGKDPLKGVYPIEGYSDEPYSDRMIACVLQGRLYKPIQVSAALSSSKSVVVNTSGSTVNGYRICARDELTLDSAHYEKYLGVCTALATTLDGVFSACSPLGYNVTRDALRIVDDVQSSTTKLLLNSLPVMFMPYWDNSYVGRYAVLGWDGNACMFRLDEQYDSAGNLSRYLQGISRSIREEATAAWTERPGGKWRNGWYEDGSGMKWYSDLISTNPKYEHNIFLRQFDLVRGGAEMDWINSTGNVAAPSIQRWGESLEYSEIQEWFNSVTISNGSRFGLFLYEAMHLTSVTSKYSIEILVSDLSLGLLLSRWLVAIIALQKNADSSNTAPMLTGVGCISAFRYFSCLPLLLLPRLKTTLAAFFVVGCYFEGEQKALAEAWFVMYPAIGEFVLFYFSLLNLLAKILQRRISDVLFGPTLLFFYFMHLFRFDLAQSGWFEFDGRVTTVVLSADFEKMRLTDFLISDAALSMNGNIKSLFTIKMVVLALNLVPFLWSTSSNKSSVAVPPVEIEKAIAIRAVTVGGLGRPFQFEVSMERTEELTPPRLLSCYELVRLGYVVLCDRYLMSVRDWFWFMVVSPVRLHQPFSNVRVCVYAVFQDEDGTSRIQQQPHFLSVRSSELKKVR